MEQVLELYQQPYDPKQPAVCMDEQSKQSIDGVNPPVPARFGQVAISDYEYVCHGVCNVCLFVGPLAGWRQITVTVRRICEDWAQHVRRLVDAPRYAEAERITLVCDNLNTHRPWLLHEAFAPKEAMRIVRRLTLLHTPKHGGWLNMGESELGLFTRQFLHPQMGAMECIAAQARRWANDRNAHQMGIAWYFRTDARIKCNTFTRRC